MRWESPSPGCTGHVQGYVELAENRALPEMRAMSYPYREPLMCTCGHPVEDHGMEPDLPCLLCGSCGQFCENMTIPIWDIREKD